MNIKFNVRGLEEVKAYLKSLPRALKDTAMKAFTEYLIGNQSHGLKHYSPYKYVMRKRAYGQTFKSDKQRRFKQRRFVMAAIKEGRIDPGVPHRTGKGQRGWQMAKTPRGYSISNNEPSMYYSMSDTGQANLNRMAGWRNVAKAIADNMAGAMRHANAAVKALLSRKV
jgi:hypothetical protein